MGAGGEGGEGEGAQIRLNKALQLPPLPSPPAPMKTAPSAPGAKWNSAVSNRHKLALEALSTGGHNQRKAAGNRLGWSLGPEKTASLLPVSGKLTCLMCTKR